MTDDTCDRVAFDAFSLAIRVICHAWEIDLPAARVEMPWALLREIADGKTMLSSPAEMAARFPRMSDFLYETVGRVREHDRATAERILRGLGGAF